MDDAKKSTEENKELSTTDKKDSKKKKIYKILIAILLLLLFIFLAIFVYFSTHKNENIRLSKDAKRFEDTVETVENQITIDCSKSILYDKENNTGIFSYKNHGDSNQIINLSLEMNEKDLEGSSDTQSSEDNTVIVCESGGILPGYSIDKLKFDKKISTGVFHGRLIIDTYDVNTREKTPFGTSIDVSILSID